MAPRYGVPKAYIFLGLATPVALGDAKAAVAARIYEAMCRDALQEELLYDAEVAGLGFGLSSSTRGLQLFCGGFDDRLEAFAEEVIGKTLSFEVSEAPKSYEAQRDKLLRELESFAEQPPLSQAAYWSTLALVTPELSVEELRTAARVVSLEDVKRFAERLWKEARSAKAVALSWGNLRAEEAVPWLDRKLRHAYIILHTVTYSYISITSPI